MHGAPDGDASKYRVGVGDVVRDDQQWTRGGNVIEAFEAYPEIDPCAEPHDRAERVEDLPAAARQYVQCIEELVGVPVTFVSVGPSRDQTVVLSRAA